MKSQVKCWNSINAGQTWKNGNNNFLCDFYQPSDRISQVNLIYETLTQPALIADQRVEKRKARRANAKLREKGIRFGPNEKRTESPGRFMRPR